MAGLEDPKEQESGEKSIPSDVAEDAQAVVEVLSEPEELDLQTILQDLGIENRSSPEALYLQEVVTGLNKKMKKLNEEMKEELKTLPSYFAEYCTYQMEMEWDSVNQILTIHSQGEEVMKFEIGIENNPGLGLGIYMKDLYGEIGAGKTNDIPAEQFKEFATTPDIDGDWGLFSFEEMYFESFSRIDKRVKYDPQGNNSYLNRFYAQRKNSETRNTKTRDVILLPEQSINLYGNAFNAREVTIDTLFGQPKPATIQINYTNPNKKPIIAKLVSDKYITTSNQRPRILNGCTIKNMDPSLEKVQEKVDTDILNTKKGYAIEDLFPSFSTMPESYQQAIQEYMSLFENGQVKLQTNEKGVRAYVDLDDQGYVLHYEFDNQFGNRPFNKNLTIHLKGAIDTAGAGNSVINQELLTRKLSDQVFTIVTKNFLNPEQIKSSITLGSDNFSGGTKKNTSIRARDKANYKRGTMTFCSKAAQESAARNFGVILPAGNAKDAFTDNATTMPNQTIHAYQHNIAEGETLTDLGANGMYGLLSKHLQEGCTVVDIGYESTATNNGRKYGHRNIAYYCYDSKERYILDPVSSFGNAATPRPIPLRNALSDKYSPIYMRYYKSSVGVYEKDA